MNSDDIREELQYIFSSSESELSIFRNLSDSEDPSVHLSELDIGSDSGNEHNLNEDVINHNEDEPMDDLLYNNINPENLEDDEIQVLNDEVIVWHEVEGNLNSFNFTPNKPPGVSDSVVEKVETLDPFTIFSIFLNDQILTLLVEETNRYAEQCTINAILREKQVQRLESWVDLNKDELLTFIGIIMWMGLDRKPKLKDYWSKNPIYNNQLSKTMSRNRFETILSMLHVCNNEAEHQDDRIYKIRPLIDALNTRFETALNPDEELCIDETMVPFRGRIFFRQYVPSKRHRYGLKLYKLCLKGGYTWRLKLYAGKERIAKNETASTNTVMELVEPLLDQGRVLYTDNFYTSVKLAHMLSEKQTHLIGTLRKKRKMNPKSVENIKLNRGEIKSKESNTGVIVSKWRDKRDVLFLTTRNVPTLVDVATKRGFVKKPSSVVEYNACKSYIDVSDQLASYCTSVRRGIKWYRKLIFELLTNTALVNAHALYKKNCLKPMDIVSFREHIVHYLLVKRHTNASQEQQVGSHRLTSTQKRGRCALCYTTIAALSGRAEASRKSPQVKTVCNGCPNQYMCLECFFKLHKSVPKM